MGYPRDSFYKGYSLSYDLARSGKDEYYLMRKKLIKFNLSHTSSQINKSLEVLQGLHSHIQKNCKSEITNLSSHERKNKITGSVIPGDIFLAEMAFDYLVNNFESILLAGSAISTIAKNVITILKKNKPKKIVDKQIYRIIEKLIKKDSNKTIIKKVIEIRISSKKEKPKRNYKSRKTKKKKRLKKPSKKIKKNKK